MILNIIILWSSLNYYLNHPLPRRERVIERFISPSNILLFAIDSRIELLSTLRANTVAKLCLRVIPDISFNLLPITLVISDSLT